MGPGLVSCLSAGKGHKVDWKGATTALYVILSYIYYHAFATVHMDPREYN